jgi:chromate transporter
VGSQQLTAVAPTPLRHRRYASNGIASAIEQRKMFAGLVESGLFPRGLLIWPEHNEGRTRDLQTGSAERTDRTTGSATLMELARLFLRLGATAFGGPAAHIAMMEDEVVRRRGWLSREEFLDLLGATNLIPGPNSTELAIHIGYRQAGWAGLAVAGVSFIGPATVIVMAAAWVYVRYGSLPQLDAVLYGVKPVIIAIVVQALWGLGRTAFKSKFLALVGAAGIVLNLLGVHELLILSGAGLAVGVGARLGNSKQGHRLLSMIQSGPLAVLAQTTAVAGTTGAAPVGLWPLFLFFLKIGSVLFGSGYVLLAFLRADLVERWRWLTDAQLLDAVAIGQVTPGPVFTTATFIGYLLAGFTGGVVATVGIFLPAFFFVAISNPLVPRIRRSAIAGAFLDGVNAASLSLMAVVSYQLGRATLVDLTTIFLAAVSFYLLVHRRLNSVWLVLGGALAGLLSGALNGM